MLMRFDPEGLAIYESDGAGSWTLGEVVSPTYEWQADHSTLVLLDDGGAVSEWPVAIVNDLIKMQVYDADVLMVKAPDKLQNELPPVPPAWQAGPSASQLRAWLETTKLAGETADAFNQVSQKVDVETGRTVGHLRAYEDRDDKMYTYEVYIPYTYQNENWTADMDLVERPQELNETDIAGMNGLWELTYEDYEERSVQVLVQNLKVLENGDAEAQILIGSTKFGPYSNRDSEKHVQLRSGTFVELLGGDNIDAQGILANDHGFGTEIELREEDSIRQAKIMIFPNYILLFMSSNETTNMLFLTQRGTEADAANFNY